MKIKLLAIPLIIFFLILSVFFYLLILERDPSDLPSALINKKIPTFKADRLFNENIFNSEKEFNNDIIIVNFFATWCGPCREEHKYINKLSNNNGVKILGINYKDNPNKTKKWLEELGIPYYAVILDKKGLIGIEWGVYGIPETFFVNHEGIIKYRIAGPLTKKKYNVIVSKIKNFKN